MSFSYTKYDRQQRRTTTQRSTNTWNYWLPVGITIASAAFGLAVWAWNERRFSSDDEDDDETSSDYDKSYERTERDEVVEEQGYEASAQQQAAYAEQGTGEVEETLEVRDTEETQHSEQQNSVFGRVSGAIRRTPSPQQLFGAASKGVASGVAAAGAVVGRGLSALKETDEDFQDHERWGDEAEKQGVEASARGPSVSNTNPKKKRMVCVVVSAAERDGIQGEGSAIEHASILSHLPLHIDATTVDLLVLIYAPNLTSYPVPTTQIPTDTTTLRAPRTSSTASSFSNIAHSEADEPSESKIQSDTYTSLQTSALRLVPHPTHIIPFTTPTGHVHLLRHLQPSLVYLQEELSGPDGENVKQIEGWVGQIVAVVGGEGLEATDTETEGEEVGTRKSRSSGQEWWKDERRVGLGRTEVVESERFEEDWFKRVGA